MPYVDGFLVPVKTEKREEYRKMAAEAAEIWKEHGAVSVTECWGDDVPEGKVTSFPMAVKRAANRRWIVSIVPKCKPFTLGAIHDTHFRRRWKGKQEIAVTGKPVADRPVGLVPRISWLITLAIRFDELIRTGQASSYAELARLGHVTPARVSSSRTLFATLGR